jgi:inner membrane protein
MPTILSHPAVPLALGLALGTGIISRRLLAAGVLASILPDLDVLAFRIGIPYAHDFGHRGASHSLAFAALLGLLALAMAAPLRTSRSAAFWFVFVAAASHGLLDMLTNGGLGVALAWPVTDVRYFFPARVIEVSPLNLHRFFSSAGAAVFLSELRWVWLPSAIAGFVIFVGRRKKSRIDV